MSAEPKVPLPPSYALRDRIWNVKCRHTVYERAVLAVVAQRLGSNGSAWPSYRRIAREAGMSVRTVGAVMDVLCNGDPCRDLPPQLARRTRRGEDGRSRGYEYTVILDPEAFLKERSKRERYLERIETTLDRGDTTWVPQAIRKQFDADRIALFEEKNSLQKDKVSKKISSDEYNREMKQLAEKRRGVALNWIHRFLEFEAGERSGPDLGTESSRRFSSKGVSS